MKRVLIAEDEPEVRSYLGLALTCHGYEVDFARDGEEVIKILSRSRRDIELLLLDLVMPNKDGLTTLREVRAAWPDLPVITLSGSCTLSQVAAVMKGGAVDFLAKPIANDQLLRAVEAAIRSSQSAQSSTVSNDLAQLPGPEAPSGSWSQRAKSILQQMALSEAPVLLRGETGVGKEVFARALHSRSKRSGRPFLKLNCAALPSDLVESELFGYEKGAFTGAFKTTPGKFEVADKGTILLDEIGDMDFRLQAKLLQVLQDREFLRLGSTQTLRVDVRVMAATHCDLETAIREKRFREDLYYRLNIVEISIPPLRQRKDEIPELARSFLNKHSTAEPLDLTQDLVDVLLRYDWPGNVRELENVIRKYLIFRNVQVIADSLQLRRAVAAPVSVERRQAPGAERQLPESSNPLPAPAPQLPAAGANLDRETLRRPVASPLPLGQAETLAQVTYASRQAEVEAILRTLNVTMWNRKRAAKLLNVDYKALLYRMKKLGIGDKQPAV